MTAKRDLTMYRTADHFETLIFRSPGGVPIDITGYTFTFAARKQQSLASAAIFSVTNTASTTANGIRIVDAAAGTVTVRLTQATVEALPTNPITTSDEYGDIAYDYFYYDFKVTRPDGIQLVYMRGVISLFSGIAD